LRDKVQVSGREEAHDEKEEGRESCGEREKLKTRQRPCLGKARTNHADNNDDIDVRLSKALALATSKEVLHVTGSREDCLINKF
jgi:hypothetical protein